MAGASDAKLSKADEAKLRRKAIRKAKKRAEGAGTRARRRAINPLLYGSEYLRGVLLEGGGRVLGESGSLRKGEDGVMEDVREERLEVEVEEPEDVDVHDEPPNPKRTSPPPPPSSTAVEVPPSTFTPPPTSLLPSTSVQPRPISPPPPPHTSDFALESRTALALLSSLFRAGENEDWGGQETLSDVDTDERRVVADVGTDDVNFEVVPREQVTVTVRSSRREEEKVGMDVDDGDGDGDGVRDGEGREDTKTTTTTTNAEPSKSSVQATKLKDMFVPREEDGASFSPFFLPFFPFVLCPFHLLLFSLPTSR